MEENKPDRVLTNEITSDDFNYSNLVKWYINRENKAIGNDPTRKNLLIKTINENPEVIISSINQSIGSDILFATMDIGKPVVADDTVFSEVLLNAFKKYYVEGIPIDLSYS